MPILQKFRDYHYNATQKVSENTRTLALSVIAIVWLLKVEKDGQYIFNTALEYPLLFVVIALTLDFLQYIYLSIVWHFIFRREETNLKNGTIDEEDDLYVSAWWNNVGYVFFYFKAIFVVAAYWKLLQHFISVTKFA